MNRFSHEKLRILILDDHAVVRRGVRQILSEDLNPFEFGEGGTGSDGLTLALSQPWNLIVAIDPSDRGGELLTHLKKIRPEQPVFHLTVRGKEGRNEAADNRDGLVTAVHRILEGTMNGQSTNPVGAPSVPAARLNHGTLSNREREVLRLISLGTPAKEIAAVLSLSQKTISTYRTRILRKLECRTTAELIRYAVMNRLFD